ncbi:hypothetical protein B0A52_04899 [Exophiala mesophila]|uniref:Aquaporin n=1 Tax=Exophiala mesophila TaxID=212818 RepID=A0A438N6R0_EXOME|nr:hypothetical protein B0A52_04899 [Exophiala mesophila]
MSQQGNSSIGSPRTDPKDKSRHPPARQDSYSLAGPKRPSYQRTTTSRSRGNSLPSVAEHNTSDDPTQQTIWGLAAPLPRIQRPGMQSTRTRTGTDSSLHPQPSKHSSSLKSFKTPQSTHAAPEAVQPSAPTGTALAPQIEVTPSRNSNSKNTRAQPATRPRPSADTEPVSPSLDLLRHATTARISTYRPEDAHAHVPLPSGAVVSTEANQRRQNLSREHVSAHDQATSPIASAEFPQSKPHYTYDSALNRTTNLVGDDHGLDGNLSDYDIVESGRRRMQQFADTASRDSGVARPTAIDWEEYNQVDEQSDGTNRPFFNSWGAIRHRFRQPFAEWLGTLVFMIIGLSGSIVHMTARDEYGDLLTAYLAWGLGVMLGIYMAGGVSGAHLNPAISIVLSIFRGFPWSLCVQYMIAQMLGAVMASAIVYGLYRDAILDYAAHDVVRAGPAFYTQPRDGLSNASAFFTEFAATAIAAGSILALGDESNAPPGAGMHAFIIGLLITAECMAFSYNTGTALNPARDLGPRLIVWAAGFGSQVITLRSWWFIWGPWCGTISGGIFGAWVYDVFIFTGGESPVNYPADSSALELFKCWRSTDRSNRTIEGKEDDLQGRPDSYSFA